MEVEEAPPEAMDQAAAAAGRGEAGFDLEARHRRSSAKRPDLDELLCVYLLVELHQRLLRPCQVGSVALCCGSQPGPAPGTRSPNAGPRWGEEGKGTMCIQAEAFG